MALVPDFNNIDLERYVENYYMNILRKDLDTHPRLWVYKLLESLRNRRSR